MGLYVTQKRPCDFVRNAGKLTGNFGTLVINEVSSNVQQVTTSYRSGKGYDIDSDVKSLTNGQIMSEFLSDNTNKVLYPFDTGHPFETSTVKFKGHPTPVHLHDPVTGYDYQSSGHVSIQSYAPDQTWLTLPSLDLVPWGTKAIKLTNPIRPTASLSEFLAQLHSTQELPRISGITDSVKSAFDFNLLMGSTLKDTIGRFLNLGGDSFLNLEFGWATFVNDISAISRAVTQSSKIVQQMIRDSGRNVHRQYRWPSDISTTVIASNVDVSNEKAIIYGNGHVVLGGSNSGNAFFRVTSGTITCVDSLKTDIWFSGSYTYKLADEDNLLNRFILYGQLAEKLIGWQATPAVIWDLAPWSWLVDWFADIGDIFTNASDFGMDGLVLRYGYAMGQQTKTRNVVTSRLFTDNSVAAGPFSTRYVVTRKQRIRATPYGFGLDSTTFTPYQWAILASLGMTRGGSQLIVR